MKMPRIIRKRRAVSPILAAILLIGLAVAAAAVLFVVVLPMLTTTGSLSFDTQVQPITFSDEDTSGAYDKVVFALKNGATRSLTVESITIQVAGSSSGPWTDVTDANTTTAFPLALGVGVGDTLTYIFEVPAGTWTHYRIVATFKIGDTGTTETLNSAVYGYT